MQPLMGITSIVTRYRDRDPRIATRGDDRSGFVLVSVLWIVVLIVSLSSLFVHVIGTHLRANSAYIRAAAAEAAADGAIRLVAHRLASSLGEEKNAPLPRNGAWFGCRLFETLSAQISVQDQDGLLDINHAPVRLLERALQASLGASEGSRVARLVAEFRASNADLDLAEGLSPMAPPGVSGSRSYDTVEELIAFGRIDHDRAEKAFPLLTVYSRSDGIDPRSAPRELLDLFRRNRPGALEEADASGIPPEFVRMSRGRFYSIIAEVGTGSTGRSVRRAVVELIRQPNRPFSVREWSTISLEADATAPDLAAASGTGASLPSQAGLGSCLD